MPLSLPPNWSSDELSLHFSKMEANRHATFHHNHVVYEVLNEINSCFNKITNDWLNPSGNPLLAFFFTRSYSCFLAAASLITSMHLNESYPLVRTNVEYASYAFYIFKKPELGEIWLKRNMGIEASKNVRKEFQASKIYECLALVPNLAELYKHVYELSIDFGAHPNQFAVTGSTKVFNTKNEVVYQQAILHGIEGPNFSHALDTLVTASICSLKIFEHIWKDRFDNTGVSQKILILEKQMRRQ